MTARELSDTLGEFPVDYDLRFGVNQIMIYDEHGNLAAEIDEEGLLLYPPQP